MAHYDLSRHALRACRALAKLIDLNSIPDWVYVAETSYDAGEWSGPALAEVQQEIETEATELVAIRFGYLPKQLGIAFTYYQHTEFDMWRQSFPTLGDYQ